MDPLPPDPDDPLPPVLVLEGLSLRQAWTRSRQLSTGAGWRLVGILIVLTVAGMLVLEVGLAKAGQWAEVLGSELTNLLCMVGVTGCIGRCGGGRRVLTGQGKYFCLGGGVQTWYLKRRVKGSTWGQVGEARCLHGIP